MAKFLLFFLFLIASVTLLSCKEEDSGPSVHNFSNASALEWIQVEKGLEYAILSLGKGDSIKEGTKLEVYYTAWYPDSSIVDSNKDKRPHRFKVGQGRVIKGWEQLIPMANKGGKIFIKLSHEFAFGDGKADGVRSFSSVYFGIEIED